MSGDIWIPELLSAYEDSSDVIYVVDSSLNITYCNAAWDRFALSNGGKHLLRRYQAGRSIVEVSPPALRPFYGTAFARALLDGKEVAFEYECSSADVFRRFHMHLARKYTKDRAEYLVIVNSLVREEAQAPPDVHRELEELCEPNGFITMCSHCRRTRTPGAGECWLWLPDLVRRMPPEVSHGLCPVCFDIHYGI